MKKLMISSDAMSGLLIKGNSKTIECEPKNKKVDVLACC